MSHINHLITHKAMLQTRAHIIRAIRDFFWQQNFLEVETPTILRLPGQEPYLSPMKLDVHDETGRLYKGYLHTSPEYTMKKYLAAGFEKIFFIGKVFRDQESFGGTHNPEFTMIEWYKTQADVYTLMDDVENLLKWLEKKIKKLNSNFQFHRFQMRDLWKKFVGVDLDQYLTNEAMFSLCRAKNYHPQTVESYEDLFYRIFLNEIEPKLAKLGAIMIHHYPSPMASLSKLSENFPGYAERVELYINGLEIANGFTELTDEKEQWRRLQEEQARRKKLNKEVFAVDMDFIEAVGQMPPSAGIALGIDRLVMALMGCNKIDDVISLSAANLFKC